MSTKDRKYKKPFNIFYEKYIDHDKYRMEQIQSRGSFNRSHDLV